MRVTHTFDFALAARGRRRQLKLRQIEVAQAAQVGREWLVDFEHGKPTLEFAKVLRTLATLGVEVEVHMGPPSGLVRPPDRSRDPPPPTAGGAQTEITAPEGEGGPDAPGGLAGIGVLVRGDGGGFAPKLDVRLRP